jgi:hypothetical protein
MRRRRVYVTRHEARRSASAECARRPSTACSRTDVRGCLRRPGRPTAIGGDRLSSVKQKVRWSDGPARNTEHADLCRGSRSTAPDTPASVLISKAKGTKRTDGRLPGDSRSARLARRVLERPGPRRSGAPFAASPSWCGLAFGFVFACCFCFFAAVDRAPARFGGDGVLVAAADPRPVAFDEVQLAATD